MQFYSNVKIKSNPTDIYTQNGILYRFCKQKNDYKALCSFNNPQCYCFQNIGSQYCKKHKNGVSVEVESTVLKGDKIEKYVFDLLLKCNDISDVKVIGQSNSSLDITYKVKDENFCRGIQVKTLNQQNNYNAYYVKDINKYKNDTIIVAVDNTFTYHCIFNNTWIGNDTFCYNPIDTNHKFRSFCFNHINEIVFNNNFLGLLNYYCKGSTIYTNDCYSESNLKEKMMTDQLEFECKNNNLSFESYHTSDSPIDCIINGLNCQLKFSDKKDCDTYEYNLKKKKNGKVDIPYEDTDNIHLFIFAYYDNNQFIFYIIPIEVMIYYGFIKTDKTPGKTGIYLAPINYKGKYHWSLKFINRGDLLKNKFNMNELINLNLFFDRFKYECEKYGIICTPDMSNNSKNRFTIGNYVCKYIETTKNSRTGNYYLFRFSKSNAQYYNIDIDSDIPDFFYMQN
jgi:hypothetical protein